MAAAPKTPLPWVLANVDDGDIFAVQALAEGRADEHQQRLAFEFIRDRLCAGDKMSFWPGGEDGRRATDFAEGKRWIAIQLRRISRLTPSGVDLRDAPPPMPGQAPE